MDHLLMRIGRQRVLMADVCTSADGHGVGYGIMLKRIERVLRFGQAVGIPVCFVRTATSINSAVFHLRSDAVHIIPPDGWRALALRGIWWTTAPFRIGMPWLWVQRVLARTLLGSFYEWVERSTSLPKHLRRFILKPRPLYRQLKIANDTYASAVAQLWERRFKGMALKPLRKAERAGREMPLGLSLPPARERQAAERAVALGIDLAAPLVTVHARESGYRSAARLRQRDTDLLRNAPIDSYLEGFAALVQRGYTVVRLGDHTMTPVTQPGVVDLASSPERTEWLEAWCVLRSEFLVGCDSGPSWLAFLAGVPVLTVNAIHFRDIARRTDRFICKLARERSTGRVLTLTEMVTPEYLRDGLRTDRYEHLDNTPADVADAIIDMIDVVHGREQPSPAQVRYNQRLSAVGSACTGQWTGLTGIAVIRSPRGALSRRFAEKYIGPEMAVETAR